MHRWKSILVHMHCNSCSDMSLKQVRQNRSADICSKKDKYLLFLVDKSSRNVLGRRGACSPVGKNIGDDNRYEHGVARKRHENAHTC